MVYGARGWVNVLKLVLGSISLVSNRDRVEASILDFELVPIFVELEPVSMSLYLDQYQWNRTGTSILGLQCFFGLKLEPVLLDLEWGQYPWVKWVSILLGLIWGLYYWALVRASILRLELRPVSMGSIWGQYPYTVVFLCLSGSQYSDLELKIVLLSVYCNILL